MNELEKLFKDKKSINVNLHGDGGWEFSVNKNSENSFTLDIKCPIWPISLTFFFRSKDDLVSFYSDMAQSIDDLFSERRPF